MVRRSRERQEPISEPIASRVEEPGSDLLGHEIDERRRQRRLAKIAQADYAVGFGKPPKATRFQPGASGNPKGRAKGRRSLDTYVEQEMRSRVTVRENGREITVTKRQLVAKQLVNKAAAGDPRALRAISNMEPAPAAPTNFTATAEARTETLTAVEHDLLRQYLGYERFKREGIPPDE